MLTAATLVTGHMIIIPYNAKVPANNEYGSTTVTCYCSYNNCRFWNCNTVYHCNYPICEEVSSDEAFDKGQCTLYSM